MASTIQAPSPADDAPVARTREVQYEASSDLLKLLSELQATLLVSTYQAGKLVAIGAFNGELILTFHNFERPMGIARSDRSLAIATHRQIWLLDEMPELAARIDPIGRYRTAFLARSSHFTGDIQCHEMAWIGGELWMVNTLFSCLCTLAPRNSFVPRWQPPFVTALAAEDRCHLNGMAADSEKVLYVTALGETDEPRGWRPGKAAGGCLIEVASGQIVARGFCMPHSPRVYAGRVWLLDSGTGRLISLDRRSGRFETVAKLPGYLRGLSIVNDIAFVGLSRIRDTSTFGGVPIAEDRERLKCGIAAVDLRTGALRGTFEFHSGVSELFDVTAIVSCPQAAIRGPHTSDDGDEAIWVVPPIARTERAGGNRTGPK
jgi:uncharacterized protein (TIGR03032 family)